MINLDQIEKNIGISFKNKSLLQNALVHRSYLNENPDFELSDNERLEFLGDAVLELIVTDFLYKNSKEPEGILTNFRASLVNTKMLASVSDKLDIKEYLYLSKGEKNGVDERSKIGILADSCEAIIGALYLDQGLKMAEKFIRENILIDFDKIVKEKSYVDYKTYFQEASQAKVGITPTYEVKSESGPDHDKEFEIGVYLNEDLIAVGKGKNKQSAQEEAAKNATDIKNW